jgi:hypothetical protein
MFKINMKYTNGKIYKLVSNVTGDVYYGSTINSLKRRLTMHKSNYKQYLKGKTNYTTSFKILETGDYDIHLVENYACLCRSQLEAIERVYIENYKCINKNIPQNRENYLKIYNKTEKRKKQNRENVKRYYIKNIDVRLKYAEIYRKNNKDKLIEYMKQYREKNIDKLREKQREKFNCPCGGRYSRGDKSRHMKSKKHQKYII